jgi:DNA-binding NtrC family response regulator
VILMSAYAHQEQLDAAERAHAFAVIPKPFPVPKLLGLVHDAGEAA